MATVTGRIFTVLAKLLDPATGPTGKTANGTIKGGRVFIDVPAFTDDLMIHVLRAEPE